MRRVFWITSAASAAVVIYGLTDKAEMVERTSSGQIASIEVTTQFIVPDASKAEQFPAVGQSGSALATAAFGMSALQPETYNGDMVASIIAASPLEEVEKVQLTSNLRQAESGDADLNSVLSDVRSALAVE
jgi:hypothetical protein